MADNVDLTPGTGTTIAFDERTVDAVSVKVQRESDIGNTNAAGTQVTVTNTSTSVLAARSSRRGALVVNNQPVDVYLDPSGGTATTSMFRLAAGAAIYLPVTCAITGITSAAYTASGDAKVHVIETYDT